jgi:hypothetical protein
MFGVIPEHPISLFWVCSITNSISWTQRDKYLRQMRASWPTLSILFGFQVKPLG